MATNKTVRVLVDVKIDGIQYRANQVVDMDADLAKPLIDGNQADPTPAAIKWALGEGGAKLVKHQRPAVAGEQGAGEGK